MKSYGSQSAHHDDPSSTWDVRSILQILTDRTWLLGLCLVVSIGLADVYLLVTPKTYASSAILYVEQRDQKVVSIQDVSQQDLESIDMMKTVEQSLTTDDLLLHVLKEDQLATNPDFLKQTATGYTEDELLKSIRRQLTVKVRRGTRLIDVTAVSRSPELSRKMVQTLITGYEQQNLDQRAEIAAAANEFLYQEVNKLKIKLEKSESDLETYREQNNAVSLEEKQNIVVDTLKDLNVKLGEARSLRMKLESDVTAYRQANSDPLQIRLISSVATNPTVVDAENRVADQQRVIAGLAQQFRPEHPKYIDAQAQLAQLQDALKTAILAGGAQVGTAYDSALANEQKIQDALKEQEQQALRLDKIAIPYNVLSRTLEADRALYQSMVTRLGETNITRSLDLIPVRVMTEPRLAMEPVGPKFAIIMALGLFAGFFGGAGLCVFVSSLDASMRSVEEAEDALGLQVLASIPQCKKERRQGEIPLVTEPYSAASEAFRSLRTVLELKEIGERQIILFTSSSANEGKTFCSVNCAVAFSQQGYKTLLIDTDLRNPSVSKRLNLPPGKPGLTDCLAGMARPDETILRTTISELYVMTSGSRVSYASELISGTLMEDLLKDPALSSYNRIILDTPPVNAVSDALHFATFATAICVVVRAGLTPVNAVHRALTALKIARGKDIGIILNRIAAARYNPYGYHFRNADAPTKVAAAKP
jgi:capsular exopolysaccharide synthesis family protein